MRTGIAKHPITRINAVLYTYKYILWFSSGNSQSNTVYRKYFLTYRISCGIIQFVIDCLCVTVKVRGQAIGLSADVRAALHTLLRLYASAEREAL